MRTWGELRAQLTRDFPNAAPDTIDTALRNEYEALLSLRNWKALSASSVFVTAEPYETGTVVATVGSQAVVGTGTVWAAEHVGRLFQVIGQDNLFTILAVNSATSIALDRPFHGYSVTGNGYRIAQDRYELGASVREVETMQLPYGEFEGPQSIRFMPMLGIPQRWEHADDTTELISPQKRTVRLWPIPDDVYAIPFRYVRAVASFDGSNTQEKPVDFMPESLLLDGARGRLGDELAGKMQAAALLALQVADTSRTPGVVMQTPAWMNPRRYRG